MLAKILDASLTVAVNLIWFALVYGVSFVAFTWFRTLV